VGYFGLSDVGEPLLFVMQVEVHQSRTVVLEVDPDVLRVENHVQLFILLPDSFIICLPLIFGREFRTWQEMFVVSLLLILLHGGLFFVEKVVVFLSLWELATDWVDILFLLRDLVSAIELVPDVDAQGVKGTDCVERVPLQDLVKVFIHDHNVLLRHRVIQ